METRITYIEYKLQDIRRSLSEILHLIKPVGDSNLSGITLPTPVFSLGVTVKYFRNNASRIIHSVIIKWVRGEKERRGGCSREDNRGFQDWYK